MAHREQPRGIRRHRRGEEDVLGDGSGSLDHGLHRRTVATARHKRQTCIDREVCPAPSGGYFPWIENGDRRRVR